MPNFSYKGRNQGGALVTGQLQAVNVSEAAADLFGQNITPIDIKEFKGGVNNSSRKSNAPEGLLNQLTQSNKVSISELIIFSRQMYSLSKSGMPLDRALRGLEASISSLPMKRVLRDVTQQLEKGLDLSGAFSRHPKVFNQLYLSLVHVGENTGRLDLAFEQVGKYLELERNTTKQIKSATRYPIFVIVAIAIALTIIMMFVIPVFAETFEKLDAQLPWQTIFLINISEFFVSYWYVILGALALSFFMFRRWVATTHGLKAWDKRKLTFPLIGSILERIALSRFSRTFAMMMKAGVPIVQSLGVIARAVGNTWVGSHIAKMSEGIGKGESLYQTSIKSGMFSPLVLQMIAVGEESGNVDELLGEVADFYDAEIEYDLKRLSAAIEPILIVCIAGMVLILALGVFLPIWDLASAAR